MHQLTKSFIVIWLMVAVGCSHYQVGRPNSQFEGNRVWIDPISMDVALADVSITLNRELRESILRNGSLNLAHSRETAHHVLKVTVKDRERESLARRSSDTGLSDVLRVEIFAEYHLLDSNEKVIREDEVSVVGQVFRELGFQESSQQRLSSMMRDLAEDITASAFTVW
ncbi:MAG: hypothetical protein MI748_18180 [Opitutales bacterium]|nr:hypothetical protein [Opitutales bacterium]